MKLKIIAITLGGIGLVTLAFNLGGGTPPPSAPVHDTHTVYVDVPGVTVTAPAAAPSAACLAIDEDAGLFLEYDHVYAVAEGSIKDALANLHSAVVDHDGIKVVAIQDEIIAIQATTAANDSNVGKLQVKYAQDRKDCGR
jgi:pyruvate/2-oxoglutarate/acetoin dehydrogenase E1 component